MVNQQITYNLCGLQCPLPLLKTQKKLRIMATGQTLLVLSDDPMSPIDIGLYCRQNHYDFQTKEAEGIFYLAIKK